MTLGDCCAVVADRIRPRSLDPDSHYVGLEHIQPLRPRLGEVGRASDVSSLVTPFEPGDTLFGRLRPYLNKVVLADRDGICSPEILVLRPNANVLPGYLHLLASSDSTIRWAVAASAGTRMPRTSPADLRVVPAQLPPLVVQRRIVDLISAIDEQGLVLAGEHQAVDRCWWSVAATLESACSTVTSIPLGQLADISGGLTKNKNTALVGVPVEVPYLRVANVHRRYLDLADLAKLTTTTDVVERLRLKPGDVLLNEGGDKDKLGRGTVWRGQVEDCIHQNHVFRARITDDRFHAEFVSAWANSFGQRWFETYGTQTTGIASISKSTLSKFPVPLLSKDEQLRWAEALDGVFDVMARLAAEADVLRELRARLLVGLLTRELVLPEAYDMLTDSGVPV